MILISEIFQQQFPVEWANPKLHWMPILNKICCLRLISLIWKHSTMFTVRQIVFFSAGVILLYNFYLLSSFINDKFDDGENEIDKIDRLSVGSKIKLSQTQNPVFIPGQKEVEILSNEIDSKATTETTGFTRDVIPTVADNKDYNSEEIETNWQNRRLKLQEFCQKTSNISESDDKIEKAIEKIFANRLISDHFFVDELNEVLYNV